MKPGSKKVVGIDVCKNSINIVHLERAGDKVVLTDSTNIPLAGNSSDNSIDFKVLVSTLKHLKLAKRLDHCDTAICLGSTPDLLQILKLPDSNPHNIIKYIHDEIRQYAVLPLKNIKTDYCAIRTVSAVDTSKQVLVGACQTQPLVDIVRDLEKIRVDISLIEPAIISLIRACYKKTINPMQDKNTMIALLRDNTFSVCVFSGQKLDFLRTKKIELDNTNNPANAVTAQIESLLQFYELEKAQQQKAWQIFFTCDSDTSQSGSVIEQLRNTINRNVEINPISPENLNLTIKSEQKIDFSPVAAGAAMKLLDANDSGICINMIPDEISEIRKSNKSLLIIVNVAAVILVCLFLHIAQLSIKTANANTALAKREKAQSGTNISQLSKAKADVNDQTKLITKNINTLEMVLPQNGTYNWAYIMAEIAKNAPQTVQIQSLQSTPLNSLTIEGVGVNYTAVNDFIKRLSECKTIASAQLEDTKQNVQYGEGFVDFTVNCTLASK
jgi:Tfp pilus assembly PilM family ATPase/Tfp pilus assembly protein PilN